MTDILLAEDQALVRQGLKLMIETDETLHVTGEASNGREAVALCEKYPFDLAILDIRMPEMNGLQAAQEIKERWPEIVVLMLTTFDDEGYVIESLTYGASGYLLKNGDAEELIRSIHSALNGGLVIEDHVAALEEAGHTGEWREDNFGYGRSYRFKDLDDHVLEIFWEVEKFGAGVGIQSGILNRAQRRPLQGVPVRRIDHINMMTHPEIIHENHEFYVDVLGFNLREAVSDPEGNYFATWMSVSPLVHEVALMGDELGGNGRLHHLAYWYGFPQHLGDLADACKEYGIHVEAGPLKHGVSQAQCMYIIEPGGNRIELFGDSGYLIFDPDWEPVIWGGDQTGEAIIWYGGELPGTFFRYGTPRIKDESEELNVYYNPIKNMLSESDQMVDISDKHEESMYRVQNFSVDK